jgi:tetratricopeptide (TPR) repeat protein
MIVKNESTNIPRLLRSLQGYIDYAVFVDTGSEDGTPELIHTLLEELGIGGEVHEREWVNFAHNRNQALKLAEGHCDYIWALDADWEVEFQNPDSLRNLVHDRYLFTINNGKSVYMNDRLVRDGLDWSWRYPVHEQLVSPRAQSSARLEGLVVHVRDNGGLKTNRYIRDAELLERELGKNPTSQHALFYLGNTYATMGKIEPAREAYLRLIQLGLPLEDKVYGERVAFAWRKIGDGAEGEDKIQCYLQSWLARPQRLEGLAQAIEALMSRGEYQRPYILSCYVTSLNLAPPDDDWMVVPWIYDWGIRYQRMICAHKLGRVQESQALAKSLSSKNLPPEAKAEVAKYL